MLGGILSHLNQFQKAKSVVKIASFVTKMFGTELLRLLLKLK